jgi:acetoin utilization deacetylase AcuC-like enzyme
MGLPSRGGNPYSARSKHRSGVAVAGKPRDRMPLPTAIVSSFACALHDTGWSHPEHQGRLPAIVRAIHAATPALMEYTLQVEADPATETDLRRVHTAAHLDRVRRAVERAEQVGRPVDLTMDTVVSGASWDAALGAAGAAIHGVRLVLSGRSETAFALTRPPGHHATADRSMGFCLFNNAAIAARWAQEEAGVGRVLVLDWDVHHGNGTQDIFYADPSVFYLSLHLSGHYPGTGHPHQRGTGAGEGTTWNITFPHGVERDYYLEVYEQATREAIDRFVPDLIIVSAGFDLLDGDPLGGLSLEPTDLHRMTTHLMDSAGAASGRVVAVLEGGYVPLRVADGVVQVIRGLARLAPA